MEKGFEVIGYFVDPDGDMKSAYDVFVAIDEGHPENLTYYCPIGQHSEGDREYIGDCMEITKEEYLKASGHLYTPKDYLSNITYTGEMAIQDELWKSEKEDLEVMKRLYNEIVAEAREYGFKGIVDIYESSNEMVVELFESEEEFEKVRNGVIDNEDMFGHCLPLVKRLEQIISE